MIVVGKIAKTRDYDPGDQPTALDIEGLDREVICLKWGHQWLNTSFYADETQSGLVKEACFVQRFGITIAVIGIESNRKNFRSD